MLPKIKSRLNPCSLSHYEDHLSIKGEIILPFILKNKLCVLHLLFFFSNSILVPPLSNFPLPHLCLSLFPCHTLHLHLLLLQLHLSPTLGRNTLTHIGYTYTYTHPPSLFGCLCSTGSKSLAAACSSPNLPSLCTIALGTKLRPHNSRPARVNSRANTVKAKTHFLLSQTSPAKN